MIWPDDEDPAIEDPTEIFSKEEWDEIIRSMKEPHLGWLPQEYRCTCGSEAVYGPTSTHSIWCDRNEK